MATGLSASEAERRAAYVKGLRALAGILEGNEAVPLPYHGAGTEIAINGFLGSDDPRSDLAAAIRAFPGVAWAKGVRGDEQYGYYLDLTGQLHGLSLRLTAYRDDVCERVVTGTEEREVEEVVQPAEVRKVTKTVDVVEWRCHPIMAGRPEGPVAA